MDNFLYIQVGQLYNIIQAIPDSQNTDTVTIEIRRLSDNYTWDFDNTEFTSSDTTGDMTFVNDIIWKQSFTPPTEDTYIVTIYDETIDVKYVQVLKAQGAVAQAGLTGEELTTKARVKEFMGMDSDFTDDDDLIDRLITEESKKISQECQRTFHAADYTEYYCGDGSNKLLVDNYPVNSVSGIWDDTDKEWGSDTQIDSDDIIISNRVDGLIILKDTYFTESDLENIKITYNAGYSTIPTDLELACIQRVVADYIEAKGGINAVTEVEVVYRPDKLRKEAQKTIDKYKRVR